MKYVKQSAFIAMTLSATLPLAAFAATAEDIILQIQSLVQTVIPLISLLAIAVFLYGIVKYIFSAGDAEKEKAASTSKNQSCAQGQIDPQNGFKGPIRGNQHKSQSGALKRKGMSKHLSRQNPLVGCESRRSNRQACRLRGCQLRNHWTRPSQAQEKTKNR